MSLLGCWDRIQKESSLDECPDTLIGVNNAIVFTTFNENGNPITTSNVFSSESEAIYCMFSLSEDLCCKTLIVVWTYEGNTIESWQDASGSIPFPITISLNKPNNGFQLGNYSISIYLDTIVKFTANFILV